MGGHASISAMGRRMAVIDPIEMAVSAFKALREMVGGIGDFRKAKKKDLEAWFVANVEPLDKLMRGIYDDYSAGFGVLAATLRAERDPAQVAQKSSAGEGA